MVQGGVQGFPAPAVEADDPGLVPAHLEAGRGGLDRGEIGVQHHVFRPQKPHRQGTDAVKIGVPRSQDDHAPVHGQGRQLPEGAGRVLPQDDLLGGVIREIVEEAPATHQHLGFADDAQGPGGEVLRGHAPGPPPERESCCRPRRFPVKGMARKIQDHRGQLRAGAGVLP